MCRETVALGGEKTIEYKDHSVSEQKRVVFSFG